MICLMTKHYYQKKSLPHEQQTLKCAVCYNNKLCMIYIFKNWILFKMTGSFYRLSQMKPFKLYFIPCYVRNQVDSIKHCSLYTHLNVKTVPLILQILFCWSEQFFYKHNRIQRGCNSEWYKYKCIYRGETAH